MPEIRHQIAGLLLQSKAIILEPTKPFTWASGWKSPIYCDNRLTLSFPAVREKIKASFLEVIRSHFSEPEVIAGVATGAIAQGALVADGMNLPFIYVRSSAKEHGRRNMIEGKIAPGQKVVVVEDLVSTGGSSLRAVEAIRAAGARVTGMAAIFSYGFQLASDNFAQADVKLVTLTDYHALIETAVERGDISQDQVMMLQQWRENPSSWEPKVTP
jgi:orotate phosphoribosyltransferase